MISATFSYYSTRPFLAIMRISNIYDSLEQLDRQCQQSCMIKLQDFWIHRLMKTKKAPRKIANICQPKRNLLRPVRCAFSWEQQKLLQTFIFAFLPHAHIAYRLQMWALWPGQGLAGFQSQLCYHWPTLSFPLKPCHKSAPKSVIHK